MTQRVVTNPVSLKERIAALQQRATNPQTSSSSSSSFLSIPSSQDSQLRDRIAKFEGKGGVPLPKSSFGFAPPVPREERHPSKRGELYGNRIVSASPILRPFSPTPITDCSQSEPREYLASESAIEHTLEVHPEDHQFVVPTTADGLSQEDAVVVAAEPQITSEDLSPDDGPLLVSLAEPSTVPVLDKTSISQPKQADAPVSPPPDLDGIIDPPQSSSKETNNSPLQCISANIISLNHEHPNSSYPSLEAGQSDGDTTDGEPTTADVPVVECVSEEQLTVPTPERIETKPPEALVVAAFPTQTSALPPSTREPLAGQEIQLTSNEPSEVSTQVSSPSPFLAPLTGESQGKSHEGHENLVLDTSSISALTQAAEEKVCREYVNAPESSSKGERSEVLEQLIERQDVDMIKGSMLESPNRNKDATEYSYTSATDHSPSIGSYRVPMSVQAQSYVEPGIKLETGPKSFRAVVHGKQKQMYQKISTPAALSKVAASKRVEEDTELATPSSPDLSSLLAQAAILERHLLTGDEKHQEQPLTMTSSIVNENSQPEHSAPQEPAQDVPPQSVPPKNRSIDSREVQVTRPLKFTRSLSSTGSDASSLKCEDMSQKSWSLSSGKTSEDSAPVRTPPSPLFKLDKASSDQRVSVPFSSVNEGEVLDEVGSNGSRRQFGPIPSSPARSVRQKVLSITSRPQAVLSRMLTCADQSTSTLALPDDGVSLHACGDVTSELPYVSEYISTSRTQSPAQRDSSSNKGTNKSLAIPLTNHDERPETRSRLSAISPASSLSTVSPLDSAVVDAFPAVPSGHIRNVSIRNGQSSQWSTETEDEREIPPTPPSKSPIRPSYAHSAPFLPLSDTPPRPPSLTTKKTYENLRSVEMYPQRKSSLPAAPNMRFRPSSLDPQESSAPTNSSSVFSVITRSFSSRTKLRDSHQ